MSRGKVISLYGLMLGVTAVLGSWKGDLSLWCPEFEQWPIRVVLGTLCGVSIVGSSRIAHHRFRWARDLSREFQNLLSGFGRQDAWMLASMSAVSEEMLFRGLIQGSFPDQNLGLWLTAAMFAAVHVGPSRVFAPWTLMAFVAGLIFGALTMVSGDLVASIVAHAVVNFLNLRVILFSEETEIAIGPLGQVDDVL